jgi:hypothetical protein
MSVIVKIRITDIYLSEKENTEDSLLSFGSLRKLKIPGRTLKNFRKVGCSENDCYL